jgi:hypothetical protein
MLPLLAGAEDIPIAARQAIAEGRLEDAGRLLMAAFALSCEEAAQLVDRLLCPPSASAEDAPPGRR